MNTQDSAIGIIDSGIGGFSVAKQLRKQLPHENLLYFGDGANTPYGNHSAAEILTMTRYMLQFMRDHHIKALLVACNTISCLIDEYRDEMDCPVLSVVQAGADAVAARGASQVGVISTCFTHQTRCYPLLIEKAVPGTAVRSRGCPDLANLVERYLGDPAGRELIDREIQLNLDSLLHEGALDCCVLGCTHYPLVADQIQRLYPNLPLVDPAQQMVKHTIAYLKESALLNPGPQQGRLDLFTTGSREEYAQKAARAGLEPVTAIQTYPPMKLPSAT